MNKVNVFVRENMRYILPCAFLIFYILFKVQLFGVLFVIFSGVVLGLYYFPFCLVRAFSYSKKRSNAEKVMIVISEYVFSVFISFAVISLFYESSFIHYALKGIAALVLLLAIVHYFMNDRKMMYYAIFFSFFSGGILVW